MEAEADASGIALGTVPGTVQEVVPGGISKEAFQQIPRPTSSVILAAIWTLNLTVIRNAIGELVCGSIVEVIRMR